MRREGDFVGDTPMEEYGIWVLMRSLNDLMERGQFTVSDSETMFLENETLSFLVMA